MTLFLFLCVVVVVGIRALQYMFDEGERYGGYTAPPIVSTYLIESVGGLGRLAIIAVLVLPIQFVRLVIDFQAQTSGLTASQLNQSILTILGSQIQAKSIDTAVFAFLIAFTPTIFSLLTLLIAQVGAGKAESRKLGAREPTTALEEGQKIKQAKEELTAQAKKRGIRMSEPVSIQVIDTLFVNSYTVGRVIYLTTGLLKTQFVKPALAHELGHLTKKDGRMLLALRRLIVPLAYWIGIDRSPRPIGLIAGGTVQKVDIGDDAALYYKMKTLSMRLRLAFFLGGLGLLLKGKEWANHWQMRDYDADGYAVSLGEGMSLQHFLREYQELDIPQPYLLSGRPYTAERIQNISWLLENTANPESFRQMFGGTMVKM